MEAIEEVSGTLEMLGLSRYEARAYMALIFHGYGSADIIAQTAQIPRTSAYKTLQSLKEKGLAIATEGRPRIFKPEPPTKVKERYIQQISDAFEKLEIMQEVMEEKGMPQLVFTITGRDRVIEKIKEELDKSTKRFVISTPTFSPIRDSLNKNIKAAAARGIKLLIITAPGQKTPADAKVVRKKGLLATDVVSDGKFALLASPELDACGYTDNPTLAAHLEKFLELMMEGPERT